MKKQLLTEADIIAAAKRGARAIPVDANTLLTPSAKEAALRLRIDLSRSVPGGSPVPVVEAVEVIAPEDKRGPHASKVIALGSDHGGFPLKLTVRKYVLELGYTVADVGTNSEQACDYPDFAFAVASLVASGQAQQGIMIDAVGVASAIAANKVPGIRAVSCTSEFVARSSREHNDANVLTLGGKVLGTEQAKAIVRVWLETWFGGGRHMGRVQKIADIERRFRK